MKINDYKTLINPMTRENEYTNCACCNREINEVVVIDSQTYGVQCSYKLITNNKTKGIWHSRHLISNIIKYTQGDIEMFKTKCPVRWEKR